MRTYSTGISYASGGQMTQEQLGRTTPVYNKLAYNTRGQLAEIRASTTGNDSTFNRGKIVNDYSDQCSGASCNGTDNNGNLKKQTVFIPNNDQNLNPTSWYQQYDYDSLNRLGKVREFNSSATLLWQQSYLFDRFGNRTIDVANTTDGIPKPNFTVNAANNQLGGPSGQSGTMSYDSVGNLTTDTYSAAAVTRTYDAENRMTSETQANSYVAGTYSYDGDGHRVKRSIAVAGQPSPVETWQVYGLGGELIAEYPQNGAAASPQKEYGYRNGQLLVTVTAGSSTPPVFTDNPLVSGGTVIKAVHLTELRNVVNQARARAGLSAAAWTDAQLSGVAIKVVHITELRARLDEARAALGLPTATYTDANLSGVAVKAVHITELRSRVSETVIATDIRWMVTDQLGTPRMIFDQTGSLSGTSRHDYLPFGEELFAGTGGRTQAQGYSASDGLRQKFTLKERDNETGLDYFLARYYSSTQGRFTSPDEFKGGPEELFEDVAPHDPLFYADIAEPQSLNKYHYCLNNPLRYIDPDGHQTTTSDRLKEAAATAADFGVGVMRGAVSSFTFGIVGAPQPNDSKANRLGQIVGTTAEGAGGVVLMGPVTGGITVGSGGTAVVTGAPEVTFAAGATMTVGSIVNLARLATTPMQRNSNGDQNSGQKSDQAKSGEKHPPRDRSREGTRTTRENIEHSQKVHRKAGRPDRIGNTSKSRQNERTELRKIKRLKDVEP